MGMPSPLSKPAPPSITGAHISHDADLHRKDGMYTEVPGHMQCSLCRPVGQIYAPYMVFSGGQGAITSQQNVVLLIVFSEAVQGLATTNFQVGCAGECGKPAFVGLAV